MILFKKISNLIHIFLKYVNNIISTIKIHVGFSAVSEEQTLQIDIRSKKEMMMSSKHYRRWPHQNKHACLVWLLYIHEKSFWLTPRAFSFSYNRKVLRTFYSYKKAERSSSDGQRAPRCFVPVLWCHSLKCKKIWFLTARYNAIILKM